MRVIIFVALLSSCTSAQVASMTALGNSADIKCWSGGEVIYDGESDGKVAFQDGGAAYWRDKKSGRLVETFADCIFTVK